MSGAPAARAPSRCHRQPPRAWQDGVLQRAEGAEGVEAAAAIDLSWELVAQSGGADGPAMARFAHTATFVPALPAPDSLSADAGTLLVFGGVDFVRDYADVASVQARRPPRAAAGALCAVRAPARQPACTALSRLYPAFS